MLKRRVSQLWWVPGVLLLLPLALGLRSSQGDLTERGFEAVRVKNVGYAYKSVQKPPRYAPDRILVRFKANVTEEQINRIHRRFGTSVILSSHFIKGLQAVRVPSGMTVKELIKKFKETGLVKYAEPDYQVHVYGHPNYPNDPFVQMWTDPSAATPGCDPGSNGATYFTYSWDLQMGTQCTYLDPFICPSGYTCGGNNVAATDMNVLPCDDPNSCNVIENEGAATDVAQTMESPIILVIDTGVDYLHQDVAANLWQNPGEIPGNGLDDDNNGFVDDVYGIRSIGLGGSGFPDCGASNNFGDPMDDNGHGTHVSSTIVARTNNLSGIIGIGSGTSNRVRVAACKFLDTTGTGFTSDAIVCLEYGLWMKNRGYNIIATSNSWGGGGFSQALKDAITAHRDAGILFIAAAGNSNVDNDVNDNFPSNYDVDNVIAVASYNQHDCLSGFSQWGARSVDIAAPGSAVLGACTVGGCADTPGMTTYAWFWGTSMATPHVSGLAAFLKVVNPSLTWWEIRNIILTTGVTSSNDDTACSAVGASGDDIDGGAGLDPTSQSYTGTAPDMKKTVTDRRVNALRAAQVAAAGGMGDYDLQARLWPYGNGPFSAMLNQPVIIKAFNVNGTNVGAAGSVTLNVQYAPTPPSTPIMTEDFAGGLPASWTVVSNGSCTTSWTDTNPGGRTIGPPFQAPFMIVDSDYAGFCSMDEELITPVIDASACDITGGKRVVLQFANQLRVFSGLEVADVDVSTDGGTTWTNVFSMSGADDGYPNPNVKMVDITSAVSGNPANVQIRWHYYNANFDWWWAIDNVEVLCVDAPVFTDCGDVTMVDDGTGFDQVAGDGIFVGTFTPGATIGSCSTTSDGTYDVTLKFNGTPYETLTYTVPPAGMQNITAGVCPVAAPPIMQSVCSTGNVVLTGVDDAEANFTTTGAYPFAGTSYTNWRVGSNGVLLPGGTTESIAGGNVSLPEASWNAAMPIYWDDLDGSGSPTGTVVYEEVTDGTDNYLIVEWCDFQHFSGNTGDTWNFQIIIRQSDGKVWYNYVDTTGQGANYDNGASATVGIQWSSSNALTYSQNNPVIPDGAVLEWTVQMMGAMPQAVPDSVEFPFVPVGDSMDLTVRITNAGFAPLTITGVLNGPTTPDFTISAFSPTTINPGESATATVTFQPTTGGDLFDGVTVATDAGCVFIPFHGIGVGPVPDIHIPNPTIDFGSITWGHTGSGTLQVQNLGAADLTILSINNSLAPSVTNTDTLPVTVMPSDLTTLNFTWNPQGCLDSNIRIENNDPDESFPIVKVLGFINVADVPSMFNFFVQRMIANGITSGCGTEATVYGSDINGDGDMTDIVFCSSQPVTRGQTAAFIARALSAKLGETIGTHVNCDGDPLNDVNPFTDVPASHVFCNQIYYIRDKGIVSGCTATQYCPADSVTRGQIAVMLDRAISYPNPVPDYTGVYCGTGGTSLFNDVSPSHPFCNEIHDIFLKGITSGCAPNMYCPADSTTRGQMSALMTKAFTLKCGG